MMYMYLQVDQELWIKTGDTVKGIVRLPKEGEKYFSLQRPTEVNGRDLAYIKDRVAFEF